MNYRKSSRALRAATVVAAAVLGLLLTSCGGGGGGSGGLFGNSTDTGSDRTLTTYAPQTLDRVQLVITERGSGATATFEFTSQTKVSPELETGTFTYMNSSPTDVFADSISGGRYQYRVIAADEGILSLIGGTGDDTPPASIFTGQLTNFSNGLDFSINGGSTSTFVTVNIGRRDPPFLANGIVTVDGEPLPLNYGGNPGTDPLDPNVPASLDGRTYTIPDATDTLQMLAFSLTQVVGGSEFGNFTGTNYSGTYTFTPDRTGTTPSTLTLEYLIDENDFIARLQLNYTSLTSGTFTSAAGPYATGPAPKNFSVSGLP